MKEKRQFEKYQDFLNKRKLKQIRDNTNILKIENKTEPSIRNVNKQPKNVIQSYIAEVKKQMDLRNKKNEKIQKTENDNRIIRNKKDNLKINKKEENKMNFTNISYKRIKEENKKNLSNKKKYSQKLCFSAFNKNKSVNKIPNYPNNCFTENRNTNMRYNLSSDFIPENKEIEHLLSSYDFKNDNELGDINIPTKIHFRNLLSLVNELKAKNELLKKELRNKDNLISSLEKMNFKKGKRGISDKKNMNDIIMSEYNNNILLDNEKLKSEVLNLNKELENQKIYYEDIINDYKKQLNEAKNKNNIFEGSYKDIEKRFSNSNEKIFNMEKELENAVLKKANLEEINRKYEIINTNQQKRIENLENQLNVVLTLVKDLFKKENDFLYPMRNKLFYEISNLNNLYQ